MTLVAQLGLSGVLIVLSALHFLWALGWWMPVADETRLARAVVGRRGITKMPGPVACATVAMGLFFAALLPHLDWVPGKAGWVTGLSTLFVLRGGIAWLPAWRRALPEEPFATLDRWVYGPLSLGLGVGFVITGGIEWPR
ncbi:DUF3995 domain-containing protein [Mesobacterium sp. TK19101]|uniref:DUF3995 domain-containing protein n=1 Tax=Mesobacterium hydrothermale TaxID=3111907 RepID=A0ABU6HIQ1_9RHOB|nr:DUF3995 domain-containing protein [Mesobacterium sp. TK19101]MEC3861020.1 DUF3995 domain-containing protein [Mesobacterium sp. TK19101]